MPEDAELAAIARCLEELERLDAPSRRRLIDYLGRRYPAPAGAEKRAHPVVAKEPGNPTVPESPNEAWQRPVGGAGGPWVPYHLPGDWGGFGMYL